MSEDRREDGDAAARIGAIETRVRQACQRAGRDRSEVTLIAVSKRQQVAKIAAAASAGLTVFGESQVQEAVVKSAELPVGIDWQLIGHLQSNKSTAAVRLFSTIHSLDRPKIIARVDRDAAKLDRTVTGFIQVNLGDEDSKHGFPEQGFVERIAPWARLAHLRIIGLMAIPPNEDDPERARHWFRSLRTLRDDVKEHPAWRDRPFGALSMGMSQDFEIAVEEGATHIRVGTALFGPRQA